MTKYIDTPHILFYIQYSIFNSIVIIYISLVMLCGRKSTKSGVTPLKRCSGKIVSGLIYLSIRCCPVSPKNFQFIIIKNRTSTIFRNHIILTFFKNSINFWIYITTGQVLFPSCPFSTFFHLLMVVCNILTVCKCSFLQPMSSRS